MAGFCEGGNEPSGSLKAIYGQFRRYVSSSSVSLERMTKTKAGYAVVVSSTELVSIVSIVRSRNRFAFSNDELSILNHIFAQIPPYYTVAVAAVLAIEPSSSFVPISLQRDVIDVHQSGEIRNALYVAHCIGELPLRGVSGLVLQTFRTDRLDTAPCTHTLLSTDVHIRTDHVRYTLRYLHCFSVVSCPHPSDSALNGIL
ncbi:hypothetical protein ANN_06323 [Periplaneta americana]|uniref:Uncharacterized protein n=1 Tax=Periplaneta americana TaxID=6978 RepID=A0ABQ8TEZ5_PERAM|nr:hypothetical protein ANN_06323 [Periplaneta americana]